MTSDFWKGVGRSPVGNALRDLDARVAADSGFRSVSVHVTAAELKNINASPKQMVAAPGAGKMICVISYGIILNHGGVDFGGGGTADLYYGDANGDKINGGQNTVVGIITNPDDSFDYMCAGVGNGNIFSFYENLPIVLAGQSFTLGNGSADFRVLYFILGE